MSSSAASSTMSSSSSAASVSLLRSHSLSPSSPSAATSSLSSSSSHSLARALRHVVLLVTTLVLLTAFPSTHLHTHTHTTTLSSSPQSSSSSASHHSSSSPSVLLASAATWEPFGCYSDTADMQKRALPYVQESADNMTVAMCLERCGSLGFAYAGIEFKHECYCSKHEPRHSERLDDSRCNLECGGDDPEDRKCGGAAALSVYHSADAQPPKLDRPLVCLVMILKNEAHTVLDTLRTVKEVVDCWYILDTGSTDGTQDVCREFMEGPEHGGPKPGQIFEEEFVDYGFTRNRVLILAKEHGNPIFTLMLSADEQVQNPKQLRAFLEDMTWSRGTMHNAYPVVMNSGMKFDSIRLARVDGGWRYRARVHEYLAPATGPYVGLYRSEVDLDVKFNATDGPRRFKSQWFIKKILEEDLQKDPNDTRSIYYLARTNHGINNFTEAFYYYTMLAERGKWDEEIYHGKVLRAEVTKYIPTVTWMERQNMYLEAFTYKPNSMDALHALAQDHFDSGRYQLAYLFALRAADIPMPPNNQIAENVLLRPTSYLYEFEGNRLLGFAAVEVSEWEKCVIAFSRVLKTRPQDDIAERRRQLCVERLNSLGRPVPSIDAPAPVAAVQEQPQPQQPQQQQQPQQPQQPQKEQQQPEETQQPVDEEAPIARPTDESVDAGLPIARPSTEGSRGSTDDVPPSTSSGFVFTIVGVLVFFIGIILFALRRDLPFKKLKQ